MLPAINVRIRRAVVTFFLTLCRMLWLVMAIGRRIFSSRCINNALPRCFESAFQSVGSVGKPSKRSEDATVAGEKNSRIWSLEVPRCFLRSYSWYVCIKKRVCSAALCKYLSAIASLANKIFSMSSAYFFSSKLCVGAVFSSAFPGLSVMNVCEPAGIVFAVLMLPSCMKISCVCCGWISTIIFKK